MNKKIFYLLILFFILTINVKADEVKTYINSATECMIEIAKDDKYGYNSQIGHRWGEEGDYTCSTLNETCWDSVGVKVKGTDTDSANVDMVNRYLSVGFEDITEEVNIKTGEGLKKGDVLFVVNKQVAQYIGNGKIVEATANELGGSGGNGGGGTPGDQTGKEIAINEYRGGWDVILRYTGSSDSDGGGTTVDKTEFIKPFATKDITCETIFVNNDGTDKEIKVILKAIFNLIEILAPVITIVFTVIDYIKSIGDPTKINKANRRTIIRLAITVIIVFIPFILDLLFEIYGLYDLRNCLLN